MHAFTADDGASEGPTLAIDGLSGYPLDELLDAVQTLVREAVHAPVVVTTRP